MSTHQLDVINSQMLVFILIQQEIPFSFSNIGGNCLISSKDIRFTPFVDNFTENITKIRIK